MDTRELEASLRGWANEFRAFSDVQISVPDKLWGFLANRMAECGLLDEPTDVVRVTLGDAAQTVKITGHTHGTLSWSAADGTGGFGYCRVDQVLKQDQSKLAEILDELEGMSCQVKSFSLPTT